MARDLQEELQFLKTKRERISKHITIGNYDSSAKENILSQLDKDILKVERFILDSEKNTTSTNKQG